MKWIVAFGRFWYDFVVGDDWTIAVAVIAAVGVTAALAHAGARAAWLLLPVVVVVVLFVSVWRARATRSSA